jgi:hypothetical protein
VIICPGYIDITAGANDLFVPQEVLAAGKTKPRKKETDKIIPQFRKISHAAIET